MENIFIEPNVLPAWMVDKYFKGKIYISIDDLINKIEYLDDLLNDND
jgi:hypothetical protein